MMTFLTTAAICVVAACMFLIMVFFACLSAWYLVYWVCGCRKAPIQQSALVAILILWTLCGATISLLH